MAALNAAALGLSSCGLRPRSVISSQTRALRFSFSIPLTLLTRARTIDSLRRRSFPVVGVRCSSSSPPDFNQMISDINSSSAVVVYSKSWCPYCSEVKGLFKQLGVEAKVIELDNFVEERQIQDALLDITGQRTVPNVFIGGKHIGGCDDTMRLKNTGELLYVLEKAGVSVP